MTVTLSAIAGAAIACAVTLGFARTRNRQHEPSPFAVRRAELLATIIRAGKSIGTLNSAAVLDAVADAAIRLGYQAVAVCRFNETGSTYRVMTSRGLPPEYSEAVHPSSSLVTRLLQERGETVIVDDYSADATAVPVVRELGFKSVVGTPVWSGGKMAAALIAGFRDGQTVGSEDVEAFELLAVKAGIALDNAQRFENERRTVERLNDLDRMKDDFLSSVSHELRTPLTAIEAAGFTLEERWYELPEDLKRQLLSRLNANARTLEDIITSLLDFARMTGGHPNASMAPVDVGPVLEAAAARVAGLFAERSLRTEVTHDLVVEADAMLIDRVVENLLSNAAKHTPKGSRVVLRGTRSDGYVTVTVSDDGPGIPKEELGHLMDRFFRGSVASTQRTRGLGLGLALVREILGVHGSSLDVESAPGRGSTFSFRLRLVTAPAAVEGVRA